MLATAGSSNQQQTTNNTDCAKLVPSPTNAMKNNIKSEPFSNALSPENTNSQNIIDETNNGINSCGSGNNSNSGSVDGGGASGGGSGNTPNIHRQNSTNTNNTTSSPKNGSDHSNCSNISLMVEGSADLLHDEKKKKIAVKEEDNGKILTNDKSNIAGNNAKTSAKNQLLSIKEEPDTLGSLVNVKKEENLSPKMSPVGFGSIGGPTVNACDGRSGTPAIKVEHSNNGSSMNNNNNNEKTSTPLGLTSDDTQAGNGLSGNALNDICTSSSGGNTGSAPVSISSGQPGQGPANYISGNSGGPMGNCMDYMQQQNHIFVFSTQLANKGAESVLSGQFQTIIAYHCTQPATKNFLEDFFMKNPMKMNKLQRQNSLNSMCNLPGAIGQPWMNNIVSGGGPLSKLQQQQQPKPTGGGGGKANLNQPDMSNKTPAMRINSNVPNSFAENVDAMSNETDLMCWEQTRNTLESSGSSESQAIKLLESGTDAVTNALNKCTDGSNSDSTIPSLQGVKVPDENLTPQQRQHRDEQLAKLKKINQFLFPENDSSPNQLNKLVNENMPGNVVPANMMNITPGNASGPPNMSNTTLNTSMRQMQPNMMIQTKSEHMPGGLGDDGMLPSDVMADLASASGSGAQCGGGQKNTCVGMSAQGNMSCTSGVLGGVNVGNISVNNMQCHSGPSGNMLSNSPELIAAFGNPNCGGGVGISDITKGLPNTDMPPVGMAQMEWSKMQQQFFEERLKGSKAPGRSGMTPNSSLPSTLAAVTGGPNQALRGNQGPPPPYHPTQRSASVPIATQSPNPSSPNNPTSNLSLPSPRTTGALGIPANSPNMDAANSSSTSIAQPSATSSTTLTTTTGNSVATKNCFQPDGGSPSNRNRGASGGLNQFNSNPSTPLSHMSPKDLESFSNNNGAGSTGDLKNPRPSPQRTRSPSNANNLIDTANIDARFASSSPGLNFNPQMQNNLNSAMNTFKGAGPPPGSNPHERQNCGPGGAAQFCRRTDNMPLNPNSNRPGQNKINQGFDPISSLAQMSQQLTSCVTNVGSSPAGGMNVMGANDINMVNQNIEGMIPSMDSNGMDHMNNAVAFGPGVGGGGNNCHPMSPLMNSMGQRMLNPKMCGSVSGFNPGPNGPGMRDGPGPNFHGVMPPSARMIGRMPVNFGNFNVSPNIQVKASTPNTIQYMPVRPQNNNNNIRMPPSLEFLQRYANPQMAGGGGGPMGGNDNGHLVGGPMNANMPNEPNKLGGGNPGNMPIGPGVNNLGGMNFFQNCNQMPVMDDDGIMTNNGMMPPHDINIGQAMIRGMRPHGIRQHAMGGPRMQAPGNNIIGGQQSQYPGPTPEGLDCPDPAALFNAGPSCNNGPNGQAMFGVTQQQQQQQQQQQKNLKSMPGGICQNMNAPNVPGGNGNVQGNGPAAGTGMLPNNDIGSGMQQGGGGPVMIGGNIPSGPGPGNPNYKPSFVGPSSNDLKYAQQYHSFQQQLYATTTRSQQQQGPGNMNNMAPNLTPNPAFFANK